MSEKRLIDKLNTIAEELGNKEVIVYDELLGNIGKVLANNLINKIKDVYVLDEIYKIEVHELNEKVYILVM